MLQIAGAVEDTLIYINNPSVVRIFIYIEKQKKQTTNLLWHCQVCYTNVFATSS